MHPSRSINCLTCNKHIGPPKVIANKERWLTLRLRQSIPHQIAKIQYPTMTHATAKLNACAQGKQALGRVHRRQTYASFIEKPVQVADRAQFVGLPAAGQNGSGFQMRCNRHDPIWIVRKPGQKRRGRRFAKQDGGHRGGIDNDQASSPDAASHSARLAGLVS